MRLPSGIVDEDGVEIRIHRAWPRTDGRLIVEGRELGSGRVRAGRLDAGGRVALVPFGEDPALPGLTSQTPAGELLVHRLKRRAVVRSDGQYRKFIAGGKAPSVADAHRAASAGLVGTGLLVPDVVASDAHSLTLTAVPGVSLHDLGRCTVDIADGGTPKARDGSNEAVPLNRWSRAWGLWAQHWPQFVSGPANAVSLVRAHTAADEMRTVQRWVELAASFDALGVREDRLRGASASVARSLLASTSPAHIAHRDLHDKQVLIDQDTGTVGIIDCDTLAAAEPALDLANLSVHLEFRRAQGLLSADAAAVGTQRIREVAETLQVPAPRLAAYASATALRLACIYAFRPSHRDLASTWFREIEAGLDSPRSPLVTVT